MHVGKSTSRCKRTPVVRRVNGPEGGGRAVLAAMSLLEKLLFKYKYLAQMWSSERTATALQYPHERVLSKRATITGRSTTANGSSLLDTCRLWGVCGRRRREEA